MILLKNHKLVFIGLFIFWTVAALGQQQKKVPIRTVLEDLESQFEVSFSYFDEAVDSVFILPFESSATLAQALKQIELISNLRFKKLQENYYSVELSDDRNSLFCAYLYDQSSGRPIENAIVRTKQKLFFTDSLGYFELKLNPTIQSISLEHMAYFNIKVKLSADSSGCKRYYLRPKRHELEEVVVQRYITKGIQINASSFVEIDNNTIGILPGMLESDVFFTIQNLPGIQSINESVSNINIRSGSNDQNYVSWNGLRLYQTGHFFGLISALNPVVIDKSTVIKNGSPAKLGEGVSGSILVKTVPNFKDGLKITAAANGLNTNLAAEYSSARLDVVIASRQSIGSRISSPTYNNYFDRAFSFSEVVADPNSDIFNTNERFTFIDLMGYNSFKINATSSLEGGIIRIENGLSFNESAVIDGRIETKTSTLNQESNGLYVKYQNRINDRFNSSVHGSYMNYYQGSNNFNVLNGQEQRLKNEVSESSIKVDATYYINNKFDIESGIDFTETGILNQRIVNRPSIEFIQKNVLRTTAFYSQVNSSFNKRTTLAIGLRSIYYDKLELFRLEPRLTMTHDFNKFLSYDLKAELKSQTSTQTIDFQTDFLGVENRKWQLVNGETIPLIKSKQLSTSMTYKGKSLIISAEGFFKEVDGIVANSQGFLNQFQFSRSAGSYTAYGLDLLINPSFKFIDSWLSYSWLNSRYFFPEFDPQHFPSNFELSHLISAGFSLSLGQFECSAGLNYHSGRPFTAVSGITDENEIQYQEPNQGNLPDYLRLDVSAKYHLSVFKQFDIALGASIWNMTNENNIINRFYTLNNTNTIIEANQNALSLTPNLSIQIQYKGKD